MEIVRDDQDRYAFVRSLFILNDEYQDNDWKKYTARKELFYRPTSWPDQVPLVSVLAWILLDNHFHILLQEQVEGGISKYMQRLGGSMTLTFNEKYSEKGSIFQGGYRGCVVDSNKYLQYVHAYITVKNCFDMYPGGIKKATAHFDRAWAFAGTYPFSSFLTASEDAPSPLIDMQAYHSLGLQRKDFRSYATSVLDTHMRSKEERREYEPYLLEEW